jgi:hypothetical protein
VGISEEMPVVQAASTGVISGEEVNRGAIHAHDYLSTDSRGQTDSKIDSRKDSMKERIIEK